MTPQEETIYWIGFGAQAADVLGLTRGGSTLAQILQRAPNPVPDGAFVASRRSDGMQRLPVKPKSVMIQVSLLRSALADLGLTNVIRRKRRNAPGGDCAGYFIAEPDAALIRTIVERREVFAQGIAA